jgi:hypothetical protein
MGVRLACQPTFLRTVTPFLFSKETWECVQHVYLIHYTLRRRDRSTSSRSKVGQAALAQGVGSLAPLLVMLLQALGRERQPIRRTRAHAHTHTHTLSYTHTHTLTNDRKRERERVARENFFIAFASFVRSLS